MAYKLSAASADSAVCLEKGACECVNACFGIRQGQTNMRTHLNASIEYTTNQTNMVPGFLRRSNDHTCVVISARENSNNGAIGVVSASVEEKEEADEEEEEEDDDDEEEAEKDGFDLFSAG